MAVAPDPVADLTRDPATNVLPGAGSRASSRAAGRSASSSASTRPGRTSTSASPSFSGSCARSRMRATSPYSSSATTRRIGDPSGQSKEQQVLPDEVLDRNAQLFAEQAFPRPPRSRPNGNPVPAASGSRSSTTRLVRLTRTGTVARHARARRLREALRRRTCPSRSPSSCIRSRRAATRLRGGRRRGGEATSSTTSSWAVT